MEISNFRAYADQIKHEVENSNQITHSIEIHNEHLNTDIAKLNDNFFSLKDEINNKVLNVLHEIATSEMKLREINNETDTKLLTTISDFENIKQNLDSFHLDISKNKDVIEKLEEEVQSLHKVKADAKKFQKFIYNYDSEVSKIDQEMAEVQDKIFILEEYCDKYVPMKIHSTISGTVAPVLSSKKKKLMKSVVSDKMQELKQNIASGKDSNIAK